MERIKELLFIWICLPRHLLKTFFCKFTFCDLLMHYYENEKHRNFENWICHKHDIQTFWVESITKKMTNTGLVINGQKPRNKNADKFMIIHKLVQVFLNIWYFNAVIWNNELAEHLLFFNETVSNWIINRIFQFDSPCQGSLASTTASNYG